MKNHNSPFARIVLGVTCVLLILYFFSILFIFRHGTENRETGWTYKYKGRNSYVTEVSSTSPAYGKLQPGDQILAINNETNFTGYNPETAEFVRISPGAHYDIVVARGMEVQAFRLPFDGKGAAAKVIPILLALVSSFVSAAVAFLIGYARPKDKVPQLFSITWFGVALIQLAFAVQKMQVILSATEFQVVYWIWLFSLQPISVITGYHGYYLFPSRIEDSRFWSRVKTILYVSGGSFITIFAIIRLFLVVQPSSTIRWLLENGNLMSNLNHANAVLMAVGIIGISAVTARNYRKVLLPDQKRRLQWVVIGSIVGVIPVGLYFIGRVISYDRQFLEKLNYASLIFLSMIPMTVAFAIVKHRLFDIRVVVRQGLQYLLARNVLGILLYLPLALLIFMVVSNPNQSVSSLFLKNSWFVILMIFAILLLRKRKQLLNWLDKKFFRSAYNAEQILLNMIDEVKNLDSISEVSRWVTVQLEGALHPESVMLFYRNREKGELSLGYSSGRRLIGFQIPEDSRLVQLAESEFRARDVSFFEKQELPAEEKEWLKQERIHLIVPMRSSDDKLIGLLLLGEKKSEEPYTGNDRKLLEGLSTQIAFLYENLSLREKVHKEMRIKEEVLAHFQEQKRNLLKECPVCGNCYDSTEETCSNDRSLLELTLPVERTIDGKYRLEKLIGRGGMGAVYKATDLRLSRTVAVKIIIGSMFGDAMVLRRFEREARTSARLSHPNIVAIYDFGTIGQGAYLVMEFTEGKTLRQYLRENGNVPPAVAADWFHQILDGMMAAHQAGVVHRDLKPENVLLSHSGHNKVTIKILDFGLAKVRMSESSDSRSLSSPGSVLGTLNYMSPEQIVGGEIDHRSDIFALGVMIVEALTGELPFKAESPAAVAMNILQKPVDIGVNSECATELKVQIQKSVAKDKKKRFASIQEMQEKIIPAIRKCSDLPALSRN